MKSNGSPAVDLFPAHCQFCGICLADADGACEIQFEGVLRRSKLIKDLETGAMLAQDPSLDEYRFPPDLETDKTSFYSLCGDCACLFSHACRRGLVALRGTCEAARTLQVGRLESLKV